MGLQTGGELARTVRAIIDPALLKIIAYQVEGPLLHPSTPSFIRIDDIRELSDIGFIVDSADEFVEQGDVIKLDDIYRVQFQLANAAVFDEAHRRIGKVIDYTIDVGSFIVEQLTVKRPLLRRFNEPELLVHRSQIIEINDDGIVIHSKAEVPEHTRTSTPGSYVNPFRRQRPAHDNQED
jgi:hypothetical protein